MKMKNTIVKKVWLKPEVIELSINSKTQNGTALGAETTMVVMGVPMVSNGS